MRLTLTYCPCRHAGVTGTIGGGANSNTVGAGSQNAYNSYNKLNSENAYNVRSTIASERPSMFLTYAYMDQAGNGGYIQTAPYNQQNGSVLPP